MNLTTIEKAAITAVIQLYFNGTYSGDAVQLKKAFHPQTPITGVINGEVVSWTLTEFIARTTSKPTAADKQAVFDKTILWIDGCGAAAVVKTKVAVDDLIFIDYITLLQIEGRWLIRHKSFTTQQ